MTLKKDLGTSIHVYHRRDDRLAIDHRNRHHLPPLPRRSLFVCRNHSLRIQPLHVKDSPTTIPPQKPFLGNADSLLDCDRDERSSGTRQSCRSSTSDSTWTTNRVPLICFGAIQSLGMCVFFISTCKERDTDSLAAGLTLLSRRQSCSTLLGHLTQVSLTFSFLRLAFSGHEISIDSAIRCQHPPPL